VIGRVRAKQDRQGDTERARVMGLVVHGDSAFAGQGVNQELLNMSELPGYTTGGTIHIILNNQIGFTTPPEESRSTRYCTDVARMLQIPVFHVNGEDPEAVAQVIRLAMSFRQEFKKDVVIDMWCYRRYGHNEGDEPMFTQPLMYKAIKARKSVREAYMERLLGMGKVSAEEAEEIAEERRTSSSAIAIPDDEADEPADDPAALRGGFASSLTKTGAFRIVTRTQDRLEEELLRSKELEFHYEQDAGLGIWRGYNGGADADTPRVETRLPAEELVDLATRLATLPEGFNAHPKITKMLTARLEMAQGARPMDWGAAEALGFASLVAKGTRIRITGQDAERGTFSHRHSVLHDQEDAHRHTPLREVEAAPGIFEVRNSPLSETGVLGFEYGYSLDTPDGLVVWEAQFGDFANVAQVIIDQFISSCEDKWCRLSALVMLLPHGFEGQGPEHSSARLERYLALSAEDNMQVVNLTTPAQWFHCLRRQVVRPYRKPLIVMSPKSLLRHPRAVSTVEDLSEGRFHRILADEGERDAKAVTKVLLCSGKLYYELEQHRREEGREDVAVLRLEQIYPLATADLLEALSAYREGTPVTWVQEEPFNMGAWYHLSARLGSNLGGRHPFACASRPESASPATGSAASHKLEQARLIKEAFADGD
jgi:2-oxoglutarate dehydrogenase E1 component